MNSELEQIELSIVIPVYCSEPTLHTLHERLTKTLKNLKIPYEIIMVDDFSKDNSWLKLKEIRNKDKKVKIIRLSNNFGQINAIMCGFSFSKGNYVITMDDDLQHPPEEIPKLYNTIKEDPKLDVVLGKYDKKKHNFIRNLGTNFGNWINSLYFKKKKSLKITSFRILKKNIVQEMIKINNPNFIIESTIFRMTKNIVNVDVEHHKRKEGKSTYTLPKLVKYALNQVFNDTNSPLKIISYIGILISFFSIGLGIYYIRGWYKSEIEIEGWTSLMVSNLFLFGIVLLTLGIIGEYLIRIINILISRQYIINQKDL